ncbi:adenosylcobinamide-GDP ribazoletransferase [bacterium]|nr:MAG: adenosylcobinamide-GDP ribazoletransferase [bacterium]
MGSRFVNAFNFLTVLPLFRAREVGPEEMGRSMAAFPLVGLVLGVIAALLHLFVTSLFSPLVEGGLLVVFFFWATGGLHMDGVADTVDGMMSGKGRERALEIMKDSRTGAHGAAAVALAALLKVAAFSELPYEAKLPSLVVFPVIARGLMPFMAYGAKYARPSGGLGALFTEHVKAPTLYISMVLTLLISLAAGYSGVFAFFVAWAWVAFLKNRFHSKLGGITGDTLGFTEETGEIAALLAMQVFYFF